MLGPGFPQSGKAKGLALGKAINRGCLGSLTTGFGYILYPAAFACHFAADSR